MGRDRKKPPRAPQLLQCRHRHRRRGPGRRSSRRFGSAASAGSRWLEKGTLTFAGDPDAVQPRFLRRKKRGGQGQTSIPAAPLSLRARLGRCKAGPLVLSPPNPGGSRGICAAAPAAEPTQLLGTHTL